MNEQNPFQGIGGSYIKHEDGRIEQVEAPTEDHPEGNCAREADGTKVVLTPAAE